jgi:hypothetical protein
MRRLGGFLFIVCLLLIGRAVPAGAEFTENTIGCAGSAVVHGDDGSTVSVNADDGEVTLQDTSGSADYDGSVATVTHHHFGEINLAVGPFDVQVADWQGKNDTNQSSKSGTKKLPSAMSNVPPGTYELSGFHQGDEGRCAGRMTLKVAGSIVSSPISAGSVVAALLFLFVFLFGILRGRPILAAVGGLLFGLFGGLDLVFGRVVGSGSILLAVLPPLLLVVGVVLALLRSRAGGGGGDVPAPPEGPLPA